MTGHLSKSLRAAAFLSITSIVLAGGCDRPRSTSAGATASSHEVSDISPTLVGKQITVRGKFSLRGVVGPYVLLDNQQAVYLVPSGSFTWGKPYSEMDGNLVAATGTLSFFQWPDANADQARARPRGYFYFAAETTQLRLISQ